MPELAMPTSRTAPRVRTARLCWVGLVAVALLCPALAAQPASKAAAGVPKPPAQAQLAGNAVLGKETSDTERCQECHGVEGHGTSIENKFAKLAGQYPEYLIKQFRNFRTGERKQDVMSIMARSVGDADLVDIAAYFSQQKKMQGDGTGATPVALDLYRKGDAARNIIACAVCHGDAGQGKSVGNERIPVLGGQDLRYLVRQLTDWRSGERRNSPNDIMNQVAQRLTDDEINALANYLSGL